MNWMSVGSDGSVFTEQIQRSPGWYWVYRPRNVGPHAYDLDKGVMLLVHVDASGALLSPLADFQDLSPGSLTCFDARHGSRHAMLFAGPVKPGELAGTLTAGMDTPTQGLQPEHGWHWCRTRVPLMHVDDAGIGPVLLAKGRDGATWVWLATDGHGHAMDIGELGFCEPLVSPGGVIDGSGDLGRVQAEFFGPIAAPAEPPTEFPVV